MKDGPAFPNMNYEGHQMGGLTKRELFAAMAMQGLVTTYTIYRDNLFPTSAAAAVAYADALLAELQKEPRV
jgi:hypothetical protein